MVREIKFRAWDGKQVLLVAGLSFSMNNGDDSYVTYEDGSYNRLYSIKLMQYTGLKDKTGKDIYEGDIISILPRWKNQWEIKYHNYKLLAKLIGKEDTYQELNQVARCKSLLIIGNIYENPELL